MKHGEGLKNDIFFIEDCSSSEGEGEVKFGYQKQPQNRQTVRKLSREGSPPLLLAFSTTSGKDLQDISSTSRTDSQEKEESEQSIEEWMILGGEEQLEDSSIQLNVSCWSSSEDFGDEDIKEDNQKSLTNTWVVSDKDKYGADQSLASRYFTAGRPLICHICNRMGHVAKNCYLHKRCPTCVLCGIQGHIQRDCPGRHCSNCGLPPHGPGPCKVPPVWNQHCQRCGMTGHLSDGCPDTWRQYHLTIRLEAPLRLKTSCSLRHKSLHAHCYNCSKRGHYGYECKRTRMISGTFPSLPYVCHYDSVDDILQCCSRMQTGALASIGSLLPSNQEQLCERIGERSEEKTTAHRRSNAKLEGSSQAGRRKTWPEKRRERREVKRRRREAQATREGGLPGRSCCTSDDEVCSANPFGQPLHGHSQFIPPSERKIGVEKAGGKSRKSREAERWKKRGGMKRGDLYPHVDVDIGSENLFSPKQRVRHRRR
ncbi:zinc finger CCHC domain-containing protein 7-like [Cololabis saira]|uniref:zinc finger CCHC domain-containing protein 7-like n=1 Tax=Cololabis saira TaxID=129043 RepID=UPI002AD29BFB|nr:zinc finger CCHC domain-containing protein 7-like [Cololabis saira]